MPDPRDDDSKESADEIEILLPHIPDSGLAEDVAELKRRMYLALGSRRPYLGMFHGEPEPERNPDAVERSAPKLKS